MKTPIFRITTSAYNEAIKTIGSKPAENGGIFLGSSPDIITEFIFDPYGETTQVTYSPHTPYLNEALKKSINKLYGIVHSHPVGIEKLSGGDKTYLAEWFNYFDNDFFFAPIIQSARETDFKIIPYVIFRDGTVRETTLEVVPDDYEPYLKFLEELDNTVSRQDVTEIEVNQPEILESKSVTHEMESLQLLSVLFGVMDNFPFKTLYHGLMIVLLGSLFLMLLAFSPGLHYLFVQLLKS